MISDLDAGAVELDLDELERLLVEPEESADEEITAIRSDERLSAVLRAIAEPEVEVRCVVARRDRVAEHRLWVTPEAAAILVQGDEAHRLSGLRPIAVPALLAQLLGLGARHDSREGLTVADDVLADLLDDSDLLRTSALTVVGADWAWNVDVVDAEGVERSLSAVDGQTGLALLEDDALRPSSATEVFRLLSTILA